MNEKRELKQCPMCGSKNLKHRVAVYSSTKYGKIPKVPQTLCLDCGEGFLLPESLRIIDAYRRKIKVVA